VTRFQLVRILLVVECAILVLFLVVVGLTLWPST
jgi:hypothetical protein